MQAFEQIKALSVEVATMTGKLDFLNQANAEKTQQISQQKQKMVQLMKSNNVLVSNQGNGGGETKFRFVDVKSMAPKVFSGSGNEGFKGWTEKVRA